MRSLKNYARYSQKEIIGQNIHILSFSNIHKKGTIYVIHKINPRIEKTVRLFGFIVLLFEYHTPCFGRLLIRNGVLWTIRVLGSFDGLRVESERPHGDECGNEDDCAARRKLNSDGMADESADVKLIIEATHSPSNVDQ